MQYKTISELLIFKCSIDFLGQHYDLGFLIMVEAELVSTNQQKQQLRSSTWDLKDAKWPSEGERGMPSGHWWICNVSVGRACQDGREKFATAAVNKMNKESPSLSRSQKGLVATHCRCPQTVCTEGDSGWSQDEVFLFWIYVPKAVKCTFKEEIQWCQILA